VGLILDTGALIAFERGDRQVAALIEATRRRKDRVLTSSGCVAQAWRDAARQVLLARLLGGVAEEPLDSRCSRSLGELCAAAGTSDIVDAHVALLARDHDIVVTSDPGDITLLLGSAGRTARSVRC
jgi:hypothetical protein